MTFIELCNNFAKAWMANDQFYFFNEAHAKSIQPFLKQFEQYNVEMIVCVTQYSPSNYVPITKNNARVLAGIAFMHTDWSTVSMEEFVSGMEEIRKEVELHNGHRIETKISYKHWAFNVRG